MALMQSERVEIGWTAEDFHLPGVDGEAHGLDEFEEKKGVLVLFTCNHCPYAQASWEPIMALYERFGDEIGFVAINSNDAETYPDDSFEAMQAMAEELGLEFPYVYDESQEVASAYRAQCTPDPYLLRNEGDEGFSLFYHGRINDNWQEPELVIESNLEEAMDALIHEAGSPKDQPPSMGCSIKWKE